MGTRVSGFLQGNQNINRPVTMTTHYACAVLRLLAVATVLFGAVATTMTCMGIMAWDWAKISVPSREWSGARLDVYAIIAHASIVAWGLVLLFLSPRLARLVVQDHGHDNKGQQS